VTSRLGEGAAPAVIVAGAFATGLSVCAVGAVLPGRVQAATALAGGSAHGRAR
jgi:hypothetical protein